MTSPVPRAQREPQPAPAGGLPAVAPPSPPPAAAPLFDRDLQVPGLAAHQRALSAGMARHRGQVVMLFCLETRPPAAAAEHQLAALRLSASFTPQGPFEVLETPHVPHTHHTVCGPRAFDYYGRLMVLFSLSDNGEHGGPRHMHLGEVRVRPGEPGRAFGMLATWRLIFAAPGWPVPWAQRDWSPFVFGRHIHFSHRLRPHHVLRLGADPSLAAAGTTLYPAALDSPSAVRFSWPAGEPRGGTQAIYDRQLGRYVAFFQSVHQDGHLLGRSGQASLTTFFGCCTFHPLPPFDIDRASARPIACPALVRELLRADERHGRRTVLVHGLVAEADRFVLSYGRGGAHLGVCSLERGEVLRGLRPARPARGAAAPGPA